MLIFHPQYRAYYRQASQEHRRKILHAVLLACGFMLIVIGGLTLLMLNEKRSEDAYIQSKIKQSTVNLSGDALGILNKTPVHARMMLISIGDINLKEKQLMLYLGVTLHYKPQQFTSEPNFEIVNAVSNNTKLVKKHHNSDGSLDALYLARVEIEPYYMMPLYPTDVQLIALRIAAADMDSDYYIQVTDFQNFSPEVGDYTLVKTGYVNQIESYPINFAEHDSSYFNQFSRAYLIYDHQNILNYLKNIQYVLLSLGLAVCSLLLNSRKRGPYLERFGLISGSVFALASNIFQINASIKPISAFSLIDLISVFTAVVIIGSFFTTLRSIKFADDDGYETAKSFDVAMFSVLATASILFFIIIYLVL